MPIVPCAADEGRRPDPVNILARPIYTKRFQPCCIKHVTGLFVSPHFNSSPQVHARAPILEVGKPQCPNAASGCDKPSQYFDAKDDKLSPGTGEGGRRLSADASSVSRCADIVRPVCSSEAVTKRRYTTRNNQNFTSEKFAKAFPVEIGRRGAAFYFWEGASATRWDWVAPIERVLGRVFDDYQRFPRSPRSPRSPPRPPPPP